MHFWCMCFYSSTNSDFFFLENAGELRLNILRRRKEEKRASNTPIQILNKAQIKRWGKKSLLVQIAIRILIP